MKKKDRFLLLLLFLMAVGCNSPSSSPQSSPETTKREPFDADDPIDQLNAAAEKAVCINIMRPGEHIIHLFKRGCLSH